MVKKSALLLALFYLGSIQLSFAVLVSGDVKNESAPKATPAKAKATVTMKLKPKAPQKNPATYESNQKIKDFEAEDEYEMGKSKIAHPASTRPSSTSPIVQTVSGPVTIDYSKARPAQVLDRGRQKGASAGRATVTGTIRSNSTT